MYHVTDLTANHIIAGTRPQLDYTLEDEAGDVITGALTTQTATIYDAKSRKALPGWAVDTDIDGEEGNLVTAGVGVWTLPAAATAMIGNGEVEDHIIAIKFTYGSGRVGEHHIKIQVYRSAPTS